MSKFVPPAFRGRLAFLSNFTLVPHGIKGYPTVEHFFVAMKTTCPKLRKEIKEVDTPGQVKRLGRMLMIRPDWNEIRLEVMEYALRIKFKPGTKLAQKLIDTGDEDLVEYNGWHDNYWGQCMCDIHADVTGENHLGNLLMKIRKEIGS